MLKLISRRLIGMVPLLLIIVTITFFLLRKAPGSPFASEKGFKPQVIEALNRQYGLDKPLHIQYFNYLKGVVKGNLGPSTRYVGRSVNDIIWEHLPNSLLLGFTAYFIALLVGLPLGIIAAVKQNSLVDYLSMATAMLGVSTPTFVLGPIMIILFSLTLYILPPARWGEMRHLILPAVTLSVVYIAYIARLTRSGMLEVLGADYIRTARAKGLSESAVVMRHALRGGILPVVSFTGPALAFLLSGTIVVERIFAVPGLGNIFIEAANSRDYFVVMGITLFISIALIVMNLLVDIVLGLLDPRISYK
ncbi:MAG: ABC transporter permease [Blastocatellia bacterium]|nr:ABC transporter permease [Blastocatellia bacterium]